MEMLQLVDCSTGSLAMCLAYVYDQLVLCHHGHCSSYFALCLY